MAQFIHNLLEMQLFHCMRHICVCLLARLDLVRRKRKCAFPNRHYSIISHKDKINEVDDLKVKYVNISPKI